MKLKTTYRIEAHALSDIGLIRSVNEDAIGLVEERQFYAVADGIGGRNAGHVASRETIQELCNLVRESKPLETVEQTEHFLAKAIHNTHQKIWKMSHQRPELSGMATTLTCAFFVKGWCIFANVGDSRFYRLREGILTQLTADDSLISDLLLFGFLDTKEAISFPLRHVITKSVGGAEEIEPAILAGLIEENDLYLLCSDGLHGLINSATITSLLTPDAPLPSKAQALLQAALRAGGSDNISIILLKICPT